ncbi:uncharacterized protein AB675_11131 [Cyphellophora attinorum]|uniref:Uncharacterized protein n=1 Tax=Cyphellophora attinorum TaxID=1664694 RepID=A0A0N1H424_9EURO|nr:uncharacterized protein AB675_11131 [Phialophora attinorum]KPI35820.1 hypothetical protein AB675_11131 [Phialophora attinorum]
MDDDASIQPDLDTALPTNGVEAPSSKRKRNRNASEEVVPVGAKWTKTVHPRGRQARDPLAQHVRMHVNSAEQMEEMLRDYLQDPTSPPEHTTVEFNFPTAAAFMVYTGDYSGGSQPKANLYGTLNRSALSVDAALSACAADLKDGLKLQKAIAKTLVEHVTKADGFRYSFHNNWLSKEDEAHRFSYFCNDSTLNKGRAANEGKGMDGKRKMKPVYDCHGTIHVKFSVTKHSMELHYKHIPIHATYEDRAPQPRKNSKRRRIMEVFEPEKLIRERKRKAKAEKLPKPPKRRATEPLSGSTDGLNADVGTDGLAPLLDFLGSASREEGDDPDTTLLSSTSVDGGPSTAIDFSADKLDSFKKATRRQYKTPRQGVVRLPSLQVPGMMAGYMSGENITWGRREKKKGNGRDATPTSANAPDAEPLAGIAAAAAAVDPALAELEALKAKLAEAEQRINRLEAEKSSTPVQARASSNGPPGWPPAAVPSSYAYPPLQFGGLPTYQTQQQQQQFQYPPPPGQQHQQNAMSPVTPVSASTPGAGDSSSLRTVQWDPKVVSERARKGKLPPGRPKGPEKEKPPPRVDYVHVEPQAADRPPRGGLVLQL